MTILNDGFLDMTKSYLCNTEQMEGVHESTLYITMTQQTLEDLKVRAFASVAQVGAHVSMPFTAGNRSGSHRSTWCTGKWGMSLLLT